MAAHRVRIENFGQDILVGEKDTILSAALDAGLDYPFLCQQGQCGACKSFLLAGAVDLGTLYNPMILSDSDRARGFILACQARPQSDCTVVVGARDGAGIQIIRDLACVVSALEHVTPGTVMLDLAPPSGESLLFAAGQYAVLTFPGQPPREYSMASRPDAPALRFHIRHVPNGRVSRHVLHDLAVGDPVLLRGPYGAAYLHEEHLGPLLLAAGGSGLAPIRSILETGLALGMTQPIHLYVGARNEADLYHEDELRRLAARHRNLRLVTALSEPAEETPRRQGLLCDIVAEDFDDFDAFHAYVAGPPAHCDAMRRMLRDRGLAEDCCFIDPFFTARDRAAG